MAEFGPVDDCARKIHQLKLISIALGLGKKKMIYIKISKKATVSKCITARNKRTAAVRFSNMTTAVHDALIRMARGSGKTSINNRRSSIQFSDRLGSRHNSRENWSENGVYEGVRT